MTTLHKGEGEYIYEFAVPSQWTRIAIKPADLRARPGSQTEQRSVPWGVAAKGVNSISFTHTSDGELNLDELYLFGVTAQNLKHSSPGNRLQ